MFCVHLLASKPLQDMAAAEEMGNPELLHLRCRLRIHTMPMGNSMPMILSSSSATASNAVVDAHSVQGLAMHDALPQICKAVPAALSKNEITIRQQIATKVQATMGCDMGHFEKDIAPDGTVTIDWKISPINRLKQQARIKSHAVLRIYTEHTTVQDDIDEKQQIDSPQHTFCYLTGCEAIDLTALMQHTIDVNTGKVNTDLDRDYDFAAQTNFCNTFNICTVVPFEQPLTQQEILQMKRNLDIFKGGIAAYEMEEAMAKKEKREPIHTNHAFMPSCLRYFSTFPHFVFASPITASQRFFAICCRHLPDVETIVLMQQGLQQVYCSNLIRSSQLVLSESNAMAFASTGTRLQLRGAAVGFYDTTDIDQARAAMMHPTQIAIQMYSAMCNMGMSFQEFAEMKDPDHIFEFVKTTFASCIQDAAQCPYKSDYVLHSVTPVSKEVAVANLQPVPGVLEYAPGCPACFYRKHVLETGEVVYCRQVAWRKFFLKRFLPRYG